MKNKKHTIIIENCSEELLDSWNSLAKVLQEEVGDIKPNDTLGYLIHCYTKFARILKMLDELGFEPSK